MAKKRANGEGNIRKRSDGRWEGRYTAGFTLRTYTHATRQKQDEAAQTMGSFYGAGHVSQSKKDERTEYPSAHLLPFPRISLCGSRCGSGGCPTF